jgi:nickel/cobalt transporter (NicO) family protein
MSMTVRDEKRHLRRALLATLILAVMVVGVNSAWAQFGHGLRPPAVGGVAGWVLARQAAFYTMLAGTIRSAKVDGSALWGLMGISFFYGIFHAAGPGHGKAVISSYLLANDETWRRGVTLSFASAVMQSLTAIAIVGVAAVLLGATAKLMGETVKVIEIISYGLIALLGARLLWVKGYGFLGALNQLRTHPASCTDLEAQGHAHCGHAHDEACGHRVGQHDHDHGHAHGFGCDTVHETGGMCQRDDHHGHGHHHYGEELDVLPWGHAHGPEPEELAGPGGWQRGLSAVAAVGLRPCSGAIIVLVFALAQGLFWAGVASTLVMGFGTAITVGIIATLAVGAKALAKYVAHKPTGYGGVLVRGVEFGAAGLVFAFGILLLTGYMASERIGLF